MALSFGDVVVLSSVVWVILGYVLSIFPLGSATVILPTRRSIDLSTGAT